MKRIISFLLVLLLLLTSYGAVTAAAEAAEEEEDIEYALEEYSVGSVHFCAPEDWDLSFKGDTGCDITFGEGSAIAMELVYDEANGLSGDSEGAAFYKEMNLMTIAASNPASVDDWKFRLNDLDVDLNYADDPAAYEDTDIVLIFISNGSMAGVINCTLLEKDLVTYRTELMGMLISLSGETEEAAEEDLPEGDADAAEDDLPEGDADAAEEDLPEGDAEAPEGGMDAEVVTYPAVEKEAFGIRFSVPEDWEEEEGNEEGFFRFMFGEDSLFSMAIVPQESVREEFEDIEDFLLEIDKGMKSTASMLHADVFEQYRPCTINGLKVHLFYIARNAKSGSSSSDYIRFSFAGADGAGMGSFNYIEDDHETFRPQFLNVLTSLTADDASEKEPEEDAEETPEEEPEDAEEAPEEEPEEDAEETPEEEPEDAEETPEDASEEAAEETPEEDAEESLAERVMLEPKETGLNDVDLTQDFTAEIAEPVILYDADGVRIAAQELEYTEYSVRLHILMENETDHSICISSGWEGSRIRNSVNSIMIPDPLGSTDLVPGESKEECYDLWYSDLHILGITDIEKMTLGFKIQNNDDREATPVYTDPVSVHTTMYGTGLVGKYTEDEIIHSRSLQEEFLYTLAFDGGDPELEAEGVKIEGFYIVDSELEGRILYLIAENMTEVEKQVRISDLYVNGISVSRNGLMNINILAGKKAVLAAFIDEYASAPLLPELGIEGIYEVEADLEILSRKGEFLYEYDLTAVLDPEMQKDAETWEITGNVVHEDEQVRITASGLLEDHEADGDLHILYLIRNKTDRRLEYEADEWSAKINGEDIILNSYVTAIAPGGTGILDCEIRGFTADDTDLSREDVREFDMSIMVNDPEILPENEETEPEAVMIPVHMEFE